VNGREVNFGPPEFMPARLTVDLFQAVRKVPTITKVALVRDGRRVRNFGCEIVQDGVTVARALVRYRDGRGGHQPGDQSRYRRATSTGT
jgi:hypothetical protein